MKFLLLSLTLVFTFNSAQCLSKIDNHIFGGDTTTPWRWPFMAALYVTTSTSQYFCGGAFFGTNWIITAAQCTTSAVEITIQMGSNNLDDEDNRLRFPALEFIAHPEFNPETLENDLGLIRFNGSFTYQATIRPITLLPTSPFDNETIASVFGWGALGNEGTIPVNELHWNTVTALNNVDCQTIYGAQITENMVCVTGDYNTSTRICQGDTGGPLVQYYGSDISVIVGIASFLSSRGRETTDPSGFTRMYPYNAWVRNITGHI